MYYFHRLPESVSWIFSLSKFLLCFPHCPFDLVLPRTPSASCGLNKKGTQWHHLWVFCVFIFGNTFNLKCQQLPFNWNTRFQCWFNVTSIYVHIQRGFLLVQRTYLSAAGFSCLSVSMSVNCTACPPPLVLKTSPWRNSQTQTGLKKGTCLQTAGCWASVWRKKNKPLQERSNYKRQLEA